MLELVEKLAKAFNYVRADLYNLNGKIYFGELTHYPVSGMIKFEPQSFDFELGKYWHIKLKYWENKLKIRILVLLNLSTCIHYPSDKICANRPVWGAG